MRRVSPPSPHQGVREEEGALVGGGREGGVEVEKKEQETFEKVRGVC